MVLNKYDRGTVTPAENFDPDRDADTLRYAVKGPGTDEDAVIGVLANRSNWQIQRIKAAFKRKFNLDMLETLEDDFRPILEWRMRSIIALLSFEPLFRDGICLNNATYGAGTDEDALVEILGTRTYEERMVICRRIHGMQQGLISRIRDDVASGDFLNLLITLITAKRKAGENVTPEEDAKSLHESGFANGNFERMFAVRNFPHMRDVFAEYQKLDQRSIETVVRDKYPDGLYRKSLLSLILMVRDKDEYFARRLWEAIDGPATDAYQLNRIIAIRCELDMVQIKKRFMEVIGKSLKDAVSCDTSGYYRKFLLRLLTEH